MRKVFFSSLFVATAGAVTLTTSTSGGNATSPLMHGILYEDIYHSGDGGLYSEMIQNRAFQGTNFTLQNGRAVGPFENLNNWHPIGGTVLTLDNSAPLLSSALKYQMRVDFPSNATGAVGVSNDGYWGYNVTTATRYAVTVTLRGTYSGVITGSFVSKTAGTLVSVTMNANQAASDGYKSYSVVFTTPKSAPDGNNVFQVTFDGSKVAGASLYIGMVSVFQQTYKNTYNGMRMDLANGVADMAPRFLRFPGGNNLEGNSSPYYLKWNQTVGPTANRPLFPGTWGYVNTNGFGLLDQLQWTLDMNLTPILALWGGLYLDGEIIPQAQLQSYIDDSLNELEFLLGSSTSQYGALRAQYGYPNPFNISYLEIGNEDYLNGGTSSYTSYRFKMFHDAIVAKYPNMKFISTVLINSYGSSYTPPVGTIQDVHEYVSADAMVSKYGVYDHMDRRYPVIVGEYAAISDPSSGSGQLDNPTLQSATSEAVYFLGLERNADVILGIAHGAMIKSLHDEPDNVALMKHSATDVVFSYSYYVTKLFANYYGTQTVPMSSATNYGPVYWSGTKDSNHYYIKIVNYNGAASTPVTVSIPGKTTPATLITLTGPSAASTNTLGSITSIWKQQSVTLSGSGYTFTLNGTFVSAVLVV